MRGVFDPKAVPDLADLRRVRLGRTEWYPEPGFLAPLTMRADDLADGAWRGVLAEHGAVKIQLDRGLSTEEFMALGEGLGRLIPERAPAVQPFVEAGVVLNLRADLPDTSDVDLQPFAESFITLHTEGSLSALDVQPRYLVFGCLVPPEPGGGGQTLVLPVRPLVERLPAEVVRALLDTRLTDTAGVPVLRRVGDRLVLCFRDRGEAPLPWEAASADSPGSVNAALASLLLAMYQAPDLAGIHWTARSLVILDNTAVVHGRSRVRPSSGAPHRHIQRLRVRAA
jgi:alpha-ketoglutarate-dependent taurine dioxygenase